MFAKRFLAERYIPQADERDALAAAGIVRIPLNVPFQVEPVNVVLLLGDPPALIDTGMRYRDNWACIKRGLSEHGLSISDIGELWLTHPHLDHFGLAGDIAQHSGAQVRAWHKGQHRFEQYEALWSHDREGYLSFLRASNVASEQIEAARRSPSHFHEMAGPVVIHRPVAVQEGLWMAGRHRATMLHVPGHSPWCTAFWLEESGILLAGDAVLERIPSNPIYYPNDVSPPEWQGLKTYARSLRRLQELPVQRVIPGHGFSFTNHRKIISRSLLRLEQRQTRMRDVLSRGPKTVYEVAEAVFSPQLTKKALFLVMSESLRHLDWLVSQGQAKTFLRGNHIYYQADHR